MVPALTIVITWRLLCRSYDDGQSADPPCVARDMPHLNDLLKSDMPPTASYIVTVCPTTAGACITAICPTVDCSVPGMTPGVDYTTSAVATVQNGKHVGDIRLDGMLRNSASPFSSMSGLASLVAAVLLSAAAAAVLVGWRHSLIHGLPLSISNRSPVRLESSADGDCAQEHGIMLLPQLPLSSGGLQRRALGINGGSGGSRGTAPHTPGRRHIAALMKVELGEHLDGRGLQVLAPQALSQSLAHHLASLGREAARSSVCNGQAGSLGGGWAAAWQHEWLEAAAAGAGDPDEPDNSVCVQQYWGLESASLQLSLSSLEVCMWCGVVCLCVVREGGGDVDPAG